MRISVVLATRNNMLTIRECIESILKNTVTPNEIIVVDDASTDTTTGVIRNYYPIGMKGGIIKLIESDKNYGVPIAVMKGIRESIGEIIFITSADVLVPINWIEEHLIYHKMYDVVTGFKAEAHLDVREMCAVSGSNLSFKRNVIDAIGDLGEINYGEDADFGFKAVSKGFKIIRSPTTVVHYHKRTFSQEVKRNYRNGIILGYYIRKYPNVMSESFLIIPAFQMWLIIRNLIHAMRSFIIDMAHSMGKIKGYFYGIPKEWNPR